MRISWRPIAAIILGVPGFIVLGLVGAVCGGVLAAAASWGTARGKASA